MYKLTSSIPKTRWSTKDNSMIFGNVVYMSSKDDMRLYHLIDQDLNELSVSLEDCLSAY